MKVAIIGAGTMGLFHGSAYAEMPGVELVGIVDARAEASEALAARLDTRAFASLETMLSATEPDVIDVCVPTDQHRRCTEAAAAAGRHVICEKPMARTLADARAMVSACEAAGVRLFVAHVVRFFPEFVRARQLVEEGAVGRPGVIRTTRAGGFPTAHSDWYASFARSGGAIMDLVIHDFDWLRWTFGEVERVYARSLRGRTGERLDYALVTLRFGSGAIAHVEGSWAHREDFHTRLEIAGSRGIVEFDSRLTAPLRLHLDPDGGAAAGGGGGSGVAVPESPLLKNPYYLELEHFIDCIRNGAAPRVTAEDGYKALEIAMAALASAETGRPVRPGEDRA